MAKTRRKKLNKSPPHPFGGRCARPRAFVIEKGDMITIKGVRVKTEVKFVLKSLDGLAADLTTSGLLGYAKRLRRYRTEVTGLLNSKYEPEPCDCGECAECERRDRRR